MAFGDVVGSDERMGWGICRRGTDSSEAVQGTVHGFGGQKKGAMVEYVVPGMKVALCSAQGIGEVGRTWYFSFT